MRLHIKQLARSLKMSGLLCWIVLVGAMLVSTIGWADEGLHSADEDRRIVHQTSVIENAADGSIVESLQNQLPELSHFEIIPERRELPFQVSADGEIRVANSPHLNFEERRLWILTLKAKAPRESDPYMDDFLQSLAEASADQDLAAEELRHREVIVSVRIHVVDQEESPRLMDERMEVSSEVDPRNVAYICPVEKDQADKLTYSVKCATSDQLRVDPATGVVSIVDPARLDWQRGRQSIEVEVRDQHGNASSSVIELTMSEPATSSPEPPSNATAPELTLELSQDADAADDVSQVATNKSRNLHHIRGTFMIQGAFTANNDRDTISPDVIRTEPEISISQGSTTEQSSSSRSLDDAARTIDAATASPIALNELDHREAAATESSNQNDANRNNVNNKSPEKADQSQPAAASQKVQQIAIVLVALVSISVVVYVMYRRTRNTRLEVMQRALSDSEARLDQYMTGSTSPESEPEPASSEVPIDDPAKISSNAAVADSDPNASFDPESLIDGMLLAETAPAESPSNGFVSPSEAHNRAKLVSPPTPSSATEMSAGSQSPLVFLNDEFLIDDILAPVSKSKEDALFASLQAQLSSINSRFEQLNPDDHSSNSQSSFTTAEEPLTSVEKTGDFAGDQTLSEEVAPAAEPPHEPFEPAYELQWDAEIQRYVKVEKRAELKTSDDRSVLSGRQSDYPSHDAAFSESLPSTGTAVCIEDDPESTEQDQPTERALNLRAELADLFNLHATTTESQPQQKDFGTDSVIEPTEQHTEGKSPEESHLDSVAKYLSQLLERSRKEDEADVFVERRGTVAGKSDGVDRREKPKPVKSYIESYLEQHGGAMRDDLEALAQPAQTTPSQPEEAPRAPREHKPVDVNHLRKNMESFRAVAVRSVETAMAAYQVRLAKGQLVGRSMLITGLIVVVGLGVGTNVVRNFHLEPLNWLICAFILLCIAEFFLRVESIRKNRREMRLKIHSAQKPSNKKSEIKSEEHPTAPLAIVEEDSASELPTITVAEAQR